MTELKTVIYTSESSLRHPVRMMRDMLRDLLGSHELAWRLAIRDISAQYRRTALGILWAFVLPLANTATWLFLSGSGIVDVGETQLPYAVYVFTGTMLWAIFVDALNAPLQQTSAAKAMLAKINFPREALAVSGLYQTLFNAAIKVGLLLAALLLLGVKFTPSLILFPLGVLSLILVGTAFGLLVTPLGMLYGDIGKSLPLMSQFLMYLTPVVFPIPGSGWVGALFQMNPLTPLILTTRDWLTGVPPVYLDYFFVVNTALVGLLLIVWVVYRAVMPMLIERMSA